MLDQIQQVWEKPKIIPRFLILVTKGWYNSPKWEVHEGSSEWEPVSFEVPMRTQMELSEWQAVDYLDLELYRKDLSGKSVQVMVDNKVEITQRMRNMRSIESCS